MPRRCAIGCEATSGVHHVFPNPNKFPERFKAWVRVVSGKDECDFDYTKKRICDRHFTARDRNRNNRLNALAVPSLYLEGNRADVQIQSEPCVSTSALKRSISEQCLDEPELSDNDQSKSDNPTRCALISTTSKLAVDNLQESINEDPLAINIDEKAISTDPLQHTKSKISLHMPVVSNVQSLASGCSSNSKKKDPNSLKSFHAFPAKPDVKIKWLKAIGRPNWLPPSHSRVCNIHFDADQINYEGCRIRVKDDAIPVKSLPNEAIKIQTSQSPTTKDKSPSAKSIITSKKHSGILSAIQLNSNFEASNVEVCRICLATDTKMYSLQDTHLGTCLDSIVGLSQLSNIDGLPKYVCCQCAPWLIKCNKLIEKCMMSQTILLDIFAKNGQITKSLIKEKNKAESNTMASSDNSILLNNYLLKHDDVIPKTHFMITKPDTAKRKGIIIINENETNMETEMQDVETLKCEIERLENEFKVTNYEITYDVDKEVSNISIRDEDNISDLKKDLSGTENNKKEKPNQEKHKKKHLAKKKTAIPTPNEEYLLKHFNIVTLSLNGQIKEWERSMAQRSITSEIMYQCEICNKMFANEKSYRDHLTLHDPSHGAVQCPVCKLRFKDSVLSMCHVKRAHSRKFYCKTCPKTFTNAGGAKRHALWHSGHLYKCDSCSFSTLHESSLHVHRRKHAHTHPCALCGRAYYKRRGLEIHTRVAHASDKEVVITKEYRCEQCNIDFASEGARRVHILTSYQHKKKLDQSDTTAQEPRVRNSCKKCGIVCSSFKELVLHMRAEHPQPQRNVHTAYPISCEICGETIGNRMKHWHHVRRVHPNNLDSLQPVITAVCDVCGKGFQTTFRLGLHQLRHRNPTVACPHCPRLFYDKYGLRRHARTHSTLRPHTCRTCGRAFKLLSNLERHAGVHTDLTPYGCPMCDKKFKYSSSVNLHVRSVHYKLPQPPRKRRKTAKDASY